MGKPPPLLPTPGKRAFLSPPPPAAAKSPLLGDRPGGLLPPPGQLPRLESAVPVVVRPRESGAACSGGSVCYTCLMGVQISEDQGETLGFGGCHSS